MIALDEHHLPPPLMLISFSCFTQVYQPHAASCKFCQRCCKQSLIITVPMSVPVAEPSPAPVAAPPAPAPAATSPPTPLSSSPAPIPPRVRRGISTRGIRRDALEDVWQDPCNARRIAELRPSPWSTIGSYCYGFNAGEGRMNQRYRSSTRSLERLAEPADRACIRPPPHQMICTMSRSRLMQTYGDTQCIRSSAANYRLVTSRRRRLSN